MQRGFLFEVGMDDAQAFVEFNFAPPSLRRAIAMLGFVHKRVLGTCHPALAEAFPFSADHRWIYHNKTLVSHLGEVRAFKGLYDNSMRQQYICASPN